MERVGILKENLESGSIPQIKILHNDLILDLFKLVKSSKQLKVDNLFDWICKMTCMNLNKASIISKVYKTIKKQKTAKRSEEKNNSSRSF